jgi:hypothetical protein
MCTSLPVLASGGSSSSYGRVIVVHDHFWLQRLVYHVSIATGAASHVHVCSLLAVATNLRLLETARIASHHHVALVVRIRHVIVLLFADSFAAVRSHWAT